jgi:catechol 2,3-dioxygenase-like lactoylglutathione lyase family enzyme
VRAHRRKRGRGIGAATGSTLAAARAFYCDVLGGRELGRGRLGDGSSALRFVFGGALVATGPSAAHDRVTLVVDDDLAIAARCWDGGFKVRIAGSADDESIVVIDPFDLELELIRSGSQRLLRAVAARGG